MSADTVVLVVGIGGPTNSGKTTLAQNLAAILQPPTSHASSFIDSIDILHQDDFCPPKDEMPWNEKWQVTDWDTPNGSSDYRRLEKTIRYFRDHQCLPPDFQSSEHRRSNYKCSLPPEELVKRQELFHSLLQAHIGAIEGARPTHKRIKILIVEGFLVFYDAQVRHLYDVRIFLRVSRAMMYKRRVERANYILEDGEVWEDPPFYFDEIVWPAYLEAHAKMFENSDVEHGALLPTSDENNTDGGPVKDLVLIEAEALQKEGVTDQACQAVLHGLQALIHV